MIKKYFMRSLALILVLAMLPVLLLTGITFASPMQYDETFLGELADKHRRLTETDGAKIVLIGTEPALLSIPNISIQTTVGIVLFVVLSSALTGTLKKYLKKEGM